MRGRAGGPEQSFTLLRLNIIFDLLTGKSVLLSTYIPCVDTVEWRDMEDRKSCLRVIDCVRMNAESVTLLFPSPSQAAATRL